MKVSIISYAFNQMTREGTVDLFGYLESCKYRYRLDTADVWSGTLAGTDDDYLQLAKKGLEERNLELVNLAVDGAHIWVDDPQQRDVHHERALAHLHAAEVLGARTVRIDAGGDREARNFTDEEFDFIVARYREYAERAADNGYRIGPENHWGAEAVPEVLQRICEAVDHPAFGVLLHLKRWHGDSAEQGDEMIAPWVMHTHLTPTLSEEELPAKMAMLREAGYEGVWGSELGGASYADVEWMLARVKRVLEGWRLQAE